MERGEKEHALEPDTRRTAGDPAFAADTSEIKERHRLETQVNRWSEARDNLESISTTMSSGRITFEKHDSAAFDVLLFSILLLTYFSSFRLVSSVARAFLYQYMKG